jgi:hypothetical protein
MITIRILAIGALALAACEARNPAPAIEAEPVVEVAEEAPPEEIAPLAEDLVGLEILDSETGVTLIDTGPQDSVTGLAPPKFALHCDSAAKTLEVVAPARQLGDYAVAGPAEFLASGAPFAGEAALAEADGTVMRMTLPLSPDLLAAIATATTARLVISDGFAESNTDTIGAFPGFAGACSLRSGVELPER